MLNPARAQHNTMDVQGPDLPINIVKEYTHHVCVKFQA